MQGPVLVTGGSGQLATALVAASPFAGISIRRVGRPEFDFDRQDDIARLIRSLAPSAVVNAAAYTAVDAAENDVEAAFRANRDGPALLATLCADAAIPLIHVSTDYVFDGEKRAPYAETDATNPQGVYGRTKLEGEGAVLGAWPRSIVLRTSWVYSPVSTNFVLTMLNAARRNGRLRVVADQKGCPTAAADLADAILTILAQMRRDGWQDDRGGIYHAAGSGWTTWHGFAAAIFEEAGRHGFKAPILESITTADWPTKAQRPADSRLDCTRLAERFGVRLPPWRLGLARTIETIFARSNTARRSYASA
jgi:dTDP-4-dehydrorhamnose reductase